MSEAQLNVDLDETTLDRLTNAVVTFLNNPQIADSDEEEVEKFKKHIRGLVKDRVEGAIIGLSVQLAIAALMPEEKDDGEADS